MEIRDAGKGDLDALVALNGEVQAIHVALFPEVFRDTDPVELRKSLKVRLEDAETTILLGSDQGRAVAYSIVRFVKRDASLYFQARNREVIDQACVTADSRGQGDGRGDQAQGQATRHHPAGGRCVVRKRGGQGGL